MTAPIADRTYQPDKLRDMLLFFISRGEDDPSVGKTKLMKLLYYADFWHYRDYGRAISWATYKKWPLGPVAEEAGPMLTTMLDDQVIDSEQVPVGPRMMTRYSVELPAWSSPFSGSEAETLEEVWTQWQGKGTASIVDRTHAEAPWKSADMYDVIPYRMAFFLR